MSIKEKAEALMERIKKTEKIKIQNDVRSEQTIKTMKKKFGVETYEAAEELAKKKQVLKKKLTKRLEKLVEKCEDEFGDILDELGV